MKSLREKFTNISLASKIAGMMSLLVMLTVFAVTFLSIQRERTNFEKELSEQAELFLETASHGLRDPLYRTQIDEITDLSNQVKDNPDITFFVVYNKDGKILVDSREDALQFSQKADELGSAILRHGAGMYTSWGVKELITGQTIKLGNQAVGAVSAGFSTKPLDQKITSITIQGIVLAIITLFISAALTVLLAQQITQPLSELNAIVARMRAGDLTQRVTYQSSDEIGQLGTAFNKMAEELQEREWLRDMFGKFVSREVADALRSGQIKLEGENRFVTILFCDIREFTAYSEKHTPEEVVNLLNQFLPIVVQAAQKYGGMVNKFGGDSTLIIYGAPYEVENSAYNAILTALEVRAAMAEMNRQLIKKGDTPLRVGVGINTGYALAGAIGPAERLEYTVVGNTVNLAARIDGLNKQFPENDILISKWTYEAIGEKRGEFKMNPLGKVPIRGRNDPIEIWSVLGKEQTDPIKMARG
jgi:class 3 adenylate cyclase